MSIVEKDENSNLQCDETLVEAYKFRLPRAYEYAGYIWPGVLMSKERFRTIRNFNFKPTDILIASYPKTGTTWISEVVSLVVHDAQPERVLQRKLHERVPWLELEQGYIWVRFFWLWQIFTKLVGIGGPTPEETVESDETVPRVFFTHLPLELLPKQALDGKCKIIYISRNPKDTAVSFFHFHRMARFLGQQTMEWHDFLQLYVHGKLYSGSWFEHVLSYWELNKTSDHVLFLKYEDMIEDLPSAITSICDFIERGLSDEQKRTVAEHCSFREMRDNAMVNRTGLWLFNQRVSKFMRKGTVGDWKNYFTLSENEQFDEMYEKQMKGSGLSFRFE